MLRANVGRRVSAKERNMCKQHQYARPWSLAAAPPIIGQTRLHSDGKKQHHNAASPSIAPLLAYLRSSLKFCIHSAPSVDHPICEPDYLATGLSRPECRCDTHLHPGQARPDPRTTQWSSPPRYGGPVRNPRQVRSVPRRSNRWTQSRRVHVGVPPELQAAM
jgi:hypothetical protein